MAISQLRVSSFFSWGGEAIKRCTPLPVPPFQFLHKLTTFIGIKRPQTAPLTGSNTAHSISRVCDFYGLLFFFLQPDVVFSRRRLSCQPCEIGKSTGVAKSSFDTVFATLCMALAPLSVDTISSLTCPLLGHVQRFTLIECNMSVPLPRAVWRLSTCLLCNRIPES